MYHEQKDLVEKYLQADPWESESDSPVGFMFKTEVAPDGSIMLHCKEDDSDPPDNERARATNKPNSFDVGDI